MAKIRLDNIPDKELFELKDRIYDEIEIRIKRLDAARLPKREDSKPIDRNAMSPENGDGI